MNKKDSSWDWLYQSFYVLSFWGQQAFPCQNMIRIWRGLMSIQRVWR
jgi:hypothetical protein